MNATLVREFRFQREHGGYIVGRRAECALKAARAILRVRDSEDYLFEWVPDPDADLSWMSDEEAKRPHEVEGCILKKRCESCGSWKTVESLWGIVDADDDCRRVVEAELAMQAKA